MVRDSYIAVLYQTVTWNSELDTFTERLAWSVHGSAYGLSVKERRGQVYAFATARRLEVRSVRPT